MSSALREVIFNNLLQDSVNNYYHHALLRLSLKNRQSQGLVLLNNPVRAEVTTAMNLR